MSRLRLYFSRASALCKSAALASRRRRVDSNPESGLQSGLGSPLLVQVLGLTLVGFVLPSISFRHGKLQAGGWEKEASLRAAIAPRS